MDKKYYQILYYNEIFKEWLRLGDWYFNTKEDAKEYIDHYRLKYPREQCRIVNYEKPRPARTKSVGRKATVCQERVN